jgi:hypothetical protein
MTQKITGGMVRILPFVFFRIMTVLIAVRIFLPLDAETPHVWGDLALCIAVGIFWANADLNFPK